MGRCVPVEMRYHFHLIRLFILWTLRRTFLVNSLFRENSGVSLKELRDSRQRLQFICTVRWGVVSHTKFIDKFNSNISWLRTSYRLRNNFYSLIFFPPFWTLSCPRHIVCAFNHTLVNYINKILLWMCRPEKENQEYEPFNAIEFIISSASFWHLPKAEFGTS